MKRIFTLLSALMISGVGYSQTFISEDFSTFTMPVQPPLASGWKNIDSLNLSQGLPASDSIWRFDNPGNHPLVAPLAGNVAIVDSDFYGGASSQDCYLTTANFDASAATLVLLEFDHFFQATGGSFGEVQVFDGIAWVSDTVFSATTGNPVRESIDISALVSGVSNAQVRFRYFGAFGFQWVIDNVEIFQPLPDDASVASIQEMEVGCSLGSDTVFALVVNAGSNAIMNFPISYSFNGGTPVQETVTATIQPLDSLVFEFATLVNITSGGASSIDVFTSLRGDANFGNDTATSTINVALRNAPYNENFDSFTSGAGFNNAGSTLGNGWVADPDGMNAEFFWGARDIATGSGNTGPDFDHTSGTGIFLYVEGSNGGNGDVAQLTSPCIDLDTLTAPRLEFWYHKMGNDMGDLIIDINDGTNWIDGVDTVLGQTHTGTADPFLLKAVDLIPFAGNTIQIRFRSGPKTGFATDMAIDDLRVYQPSSTDIGVSSIVSPTTNCGLGAADSVCVLIANYGTAAVSNFPVNYVLNNGTVVTETYVPTLNVGDTARYCFNTTVNVSTPGAYTVGAYTSASMDGDVSNDSAFSTFDNIPIISGFPYTEGFEAGNGGWVSGGTNNSWVIGTPAASVINSAANGLNSYVTNRTGNYNNNEASFVVGPCFDFSTLNAPQFKMNVWWNSEFSWDGAVLQSSIDGGTSWQQVGAFGDPNNWYNDNTINGLQNAGFSGEGWSGRNSSTNGSGGWVLAEHDLTGLANSPAVILRIAFGSDGSVDDEGFAFDDILIQDAPAVDAGITEIVSPVTNCGLSAMDSVCILVANFGSAPISNVPVSYIFNGNTFNGTISSTINAGDTIRYCFATTVDVSVPNTYSIQAYTAIPSDGNLLNDSSSNVFDNIPIVSGYPYTEGFESGNGGWVSGGINNSWAIGTPAASIINSAANGLNSYVTNLTANYNNNEASFVVGPCFDFSSLNAPEFKMNVWWNSEFSWDGAVLQSSIDGGTSWQQVGAFGDPNNWYNDNTINGLTNAGFSGEGWSGRNASGDGSGGWVLAEHDLTSLANSPAVILRIMFGSDGSVDDEGFAFDDITIQDKSPTEIGAFAIVAPITGCGLTATETVTISIVNYGSAAVSNFPVSYEFNGGTAVTETFTGTINPGDTVLYTFTTSTIDVSIPSTTYGIDAYTSLAMDGNLNNDTTSGIITHIPSYSVPYSEDFELSNGDWLTNGVNSSWQRGAPNGTPINSAGQGLNSWVTNLTGNYNTNEISYLVSPCIDFSSITADPLIRFSMTFAFGFNGDAWLEQSIAGGPWTTISDNGGAIEWYNNTGLQRWDGTSSGGAGVWVTAENTLIGVSGQSGVRFRFVMDGDPFSTGAGIGIDDINIDLPPAADAGVIALTAPGTNCGFGPSDSVKIQLKNFGSAALTSIPVSYILNGGTPVTETIVTNLLPGDTLDYTFTSATVNLSATGSYTFNLSTSVTADGNPTNDAISVTVENTLQTLPYTENFDSFTPGTGFNNGGSILGNGWIATPDGSNAGFFWGARNTATGSGNTGPDFDNTTGVSGAGNFIFVEGSNGGNGDIAELVSPCIDIVSAVTPRLDFWYHKFGANMGDMIVDIYDGAVWTSGVFTIVGQTHTATADPFLFASVDLTAFAGNTIQVRFRSTAKTGFATDMAIDDFVVVDQPVSVNNIDDEEKLGFRILPNPSSGLFTLVAPEVNTSINIEIVDTKGQLVHSSIISASNARRNDFDLSSNAKGIYFVKISDGNSSRVEKLVIK